MFFARGDVLQPSLKWLFDLEGIFSLHDQTVVQRNTIGTHLELFYACKNTQNREQCYIFLKTPVFIRKDMAFLYFCGNY